MQPLIATLGLFVQGHSQQRVYRMRFKHLWVVIIMSRHTQKKGELRFGQVLVEWDGANNTTPLFTRGRTTLEFLTRLPGRVRKGGRCGEKERMEDLRARGGLTKSPRGIDPCLQWW